MSKKDHNLQISVAGSIPPASQNNGFATISEFHPKMMSVPGFVPPTEVTQNLCPLPSCSQEDINQFRSAGVLLKALAAEVRAWSEKLPADHRPAIMALLHGNIQMEVRNLTQVSFDGIRVEGLLNGNPCSVLTHQNTVQLMCYAELIDEDGEEEIPHRPIGFIWPDHNENI